MSGLGQPSAATQQWAEQFAKKIRHLPEIAMQSALARQWLTDESPEKVASVLVYLFGNPSLPSQDWQILDQLLFALGDEGLDYELRARLYEAAKTLGFDDLSAMLFDWKLEDGESQKLKEKLDDPVQVIPRGKPLTLGERKTLARSGKRDLLLHILRDVHPHVVQIVLDNPKVLEADIVRLAARRPHLSSSLEIIGRHATWRPRERIREALVCNPYTSFSTAARLLATLSTHRISWLLDGGYLHKRIQKMGALILFRRKGPST